MEYRGIRNNKEVGVGVPEDDEVQDVLDREGEDSEGGQCGAEDDEMDTGTEGEGEGPTENGGEDDVMELGASLQGGSLKARRTAHQTRTRAPMDGRGKRRADTAPAARVPDPKRLKQVRLDEMYDPEWQTTFDHLFLQWWYIGGVPFERARMPEYRALTRHLQNMPLGMKPTLPQFKRIACSGIQEERAYIVDKLRDIREQMQNTGATILTDRQTSSCSAGRRSGTLPPGSLTDEDIVHQARRMQRASTVRHPPAIQTMFGRRAAHIELYHEEIEYDPPTNPHAADEMEAGPWTDPEDLEQRGSDTPDVGDEFGGESDHEAASDMCSRDRQSHCDVDRMTPPLTRSATDRRRNQTQVVRSSSEDEGGDRSDDGDAADNEDSDVEREGPDQDRGHGDEYGFDGGDGNGLIEDGAGGAFLVTPSPSAAGGGGSGGHGFGLAVPQGSIPSGIFSDGFDLGRPPTSDAWRGGDTTRAREMGCSVGEVTAARLAAECRHDGPADVADGGGLSTEGHVVDRADDHQEDARVGLGGLCGASDTVLPTTDEADGGDGAATIVAGGLLGCDGTEVDAMVAHRNEEERQVDPGDVVAHPVEAHVPNMFPLERHTVGIDPVMGRSKHISKRLWKAVPPCSFMPVSPPAPSGVPGDIGKTMEMADLFKQLTGRRVIDPGGVSWGAGPVAAGKRPACAGAVSGRGGESGDSFVGGGGGPAVVGGRSGLSGGSFGWGEGSAAPATAGERGQVQGSPSPSLKAKGKSVSWSGISRVTRKLKDAMPGVTGERRDREGRLTEMFADAADWVWKGERLEHPSVGSSCAADRRGSTMVAPPSRLPTTGEAQRDGHQCPKGRSSTRALPGARPPPALLEDNPDLVTLQTSRGGCTSTAHRILDEEPRRQTGTGPGSRRAAGGRTEDSTTDGVPMPRGRKTYTTLTGVLGRSAGGGVEREAEVQEAERVAARAVASRAVSASQHLERERRRR
ncbi:hypothetical protein CBR_g26476 [Chara braunii]|uniref:Uncharacterized protein n=1 Tax=Chara braunii TaxID=69332 RepID=A0A388L828_CHABU|nr:hypothetical protein CBR_g26476 [Chara braunii]|eukprot:GBG78447.1 hypothetical protein CBR_g26476 [Chara braunii]